MKKLSRQPNQYLFFELARLRTLWVNNEDIRDRVEKRYKEVKDEFTNRRLRFTLNEHKLDTILRKREEEKNRLFTCEVVAVEKAKHKVGPLKGKEIDGVYEYTISTMKDTKLDKDTFQGKEGKWITLDNGQHIFLREGESVNEAISRLNKPKGDIDIETDVKSPKGYDFSLLEKDPKYWYYEQDMFVNETSLAVKDGKVIGAVGYKDKKNEIEIDKIIVAPESRGEGTGSKLMNNIMDAADKENKKIIAYPLNDKAKEFFHGLGFTGEVSVGRKPKSKKIDKEEKSTILSRTIGTQIEANIGDKLAVKKISNRVYGVISRINTEKET